MPPEDRVGQVGDFWLSKRPGSDQWCRTWYDQGARQTRRASLGTEDFQRALQLLVEWAAGQYKIRDATPAECPLAHVLTRYWSDNAQHKPSAPEIKIAIRYWTEWWGAAMVSELTLDRQAEFVAWLRSKGRSDGYVSLILSRGRAALNDARKHGVITSAPFVPDIETAEDRRQKTPIGRPLHMREVAKLLDAVKSEHLWRFCVLLLNTMARPAALLDLEAGQVDRDHGFINLLPAGTRQTKKRRPCVPITKTLLPWLGAWDAERTAARRKAAALNQPLVDDTDLYVSYHGKPVQRIVTGWRALRDSAGLDDQVNPYSIRHTLGRELRRRRVPGDEISLMLGHMPVGLNDTTAIYSPYDPDYCQTAAAAIDDYCTEVSGMMTVRRLVSGRQALRVVG